LVDEFSGKQAEVSAPGIDESGLIPRKGYFFVIFAAVLWAVSGVAGKFLFHRGIEPLQLIQLRVTLSAASLFLFLLVFRPALLRISARDFFYFAVLGIAGMGMVQSAYLYSISKIHVAVAILLEYLAPVFIAMYYVFVAPEKLTRITLIAIGISVTGCYLAVGAYNIDLLTMNWQGIVSGVVSGIAYAFYGVYCEKGMRKYDPWTVVFYALVFAALFWNATVFALGDVKLSHTGVDWFWILYIAVMGTVVPYGFYSAGISLVRSTRACVTATLEPISAGFIAFFFLGEVLGPLQILGGILVMASVTLLQIGREHDMNTSHLIRKRAEQISAGQNGNAPARG